MGVKLDEKWLSLSAELSLSVAPAASDNVQEIAAVTSGRMVLRFAFISLPSPDMGQSVWSSSATSNLATAPGQSLPRYQYPGLRLQHCTIRIKLRRARQIGRVTQFASPTPPNCDRHSTQNRRGLRKGQAMNAW